MASVALRWNFGRFLLEIARWPVLWRPQMEICEVLLKVLLDGNEKLHADLG